jgi:hypothetical protein
MEFLYLAVLLAAPVFVHDLAHSDEFPTLMRVHLTANLFALFWIGDTFIDVYGFVDWFAA